MSKLSFRARALDATKPMPIYLTEELPDLPDYSAINRAVPQMPSGMEKEEESEHHLQRAISGTGLIIPTPEVCQVSDIQFYERCYPPDYKMPKQHIHMQPIWEEQETPEYDIDSEDERWLKQQRHPELTELKFEQMMDKLEKSSGQTVVTLNEAKMLLERHDDLIIAVYDYWLNKRLTTQHPLILSVKTEHRPGQSSNNPYLAFRRRTEKMQTRKNRKNDESSYEKMLKLHRDLSRARSLLELVAQREQFKRELVQLTAHVAEKRFIARDFSNQLPDPPPRPQYTVPISSSNFRRDSFSSALPHYPPRPPATPIDQPRQREKRPYKRRKHRPAAAPGSALGLRDSGVYTSSEEESGRAEAASPPDDGPFAFRRKPGCYYEMPTSTLNGDPVDPEDSSKERLYQHELDPRHRYVLTSLRTPYRRYIGFARRRVTRGGRLALDRIATPLDDLWPELPLRDSADGNLDEVELEKNRYRSPIEINRDYHTSGRYPWRHAFRRHLARNPHLWTSDPTQTDPCQKDPFDKNLFETDPFIKNPLRKESYGEEDMKMDTSDLPDLIQDSVKSDTSVRTVSGKVASSSGKRKRSYSDCSDSSYDSDQSLQPVEKEFEKLYDEINSEWLHFRPKTPPPSPPPPPDSPDQFSLALDTPVSVQLLGSDNPADALGPFTTSEFTLGQLYPEMQELGSSGDRFDVSSEQLRGSHFTGLTEDRVESRLSEMDRKSLSDGTNKIVDLPSDVLSRIGGACLPHTHRKGECFGSSTVRVPPPPREAVVCAPPAPAPPAPAPPAPAPPPPARVPPPPPPLVPTATHVTSIKVRAPAAPAPPVAPAPVPSANIIVEEVNELPHKYHTTKRDDVIDEIQLTHGVQLKTVQTKHSPLKKHIISGGGRAAGGAGVGGAGAGVAGPGAGPRLLTVSVSQPQLVTVAVSDNLKAQLQNHLLSSQAGMLVQNGPFPPVVLPVHHRDNVVTGVSSSSAGLRRSAPLVALSASRALPQHQSPLVVAQPHIQHVPPNKLKVLHAHPLTQSQRAQLLQSRSQMPTVVSLATIGDVKKNLKSPVAQLFEIKSGQLGKGTHLVNVVRQPAPGKTTLTRVDFNDKNKVVLDAALKGNITTAPRHRVAVMDGRQIVRARTALPSVRAPLRHQIQLKNRPVCVSGAGAGNSAHKPAPIPAAVVTNLLHNNIQLPKGGPKLSLSSSAGHTLSANVQAITLSAAHVAHARQARLIPQARLPPQAEIVEASTAPVATTSQQDASEGSSKTDSNGTVRRRTAETLPMEVT